MNSDDVRAFYDEFLKSKMLDYRIYGNARIDKAIERILEYIEPNSRALDVGCGIGIVPEHVSEVATDGHVWACDISDRNVWYARQTVDRPNVTFFVADVAAEIDYLHETVTDPIDVVSLVDVIEHIPIDQHGTLFEALGKICAEDAVVVLTYPSPQYQRYLMEEEPEGLQIIDQVVERDALLRAASQGGFTLKHYSLEAVWKENQYVHCVLQTDDSLSPVPPPEKPSGLDRITQKMKALWKRHVIYPKRRKRYTQFLSVDDHE